MPDEINIQDILKHADAQELRAFLRREARRNSDLSIRLKVLLLEKLDLPPSVNRYQSILNEIVRIDVHGKIRMTARKAKLIREISEQFLQTAGKALADMEYRQCHQILISVLQKLHQCVDKPAMPDPRLIQVINAAYRQLSALALKQIAPEFRERLYNDATDAIGLSYYRIWDETLNMCAIALQTQNDDQQLHQLHELLGKKLNGESDRLKWTAWFLIVQSGTTMPVPGQIPGHKKSESIALIKVLKRIGHPGGIARAIDILYTEASLKEHQREEWANLRFDAARHERNSEDIINWGLEYLGLKRDVEIVRQISLALSKRDQKDLRRHARTVGGIPLEGFVLAGERRWEELSELIGTHKALDVLAEHFRDLIHHDRDTTLQLLRQIAPEYLVHHAGPRCANVVRAIFNGLDHAGEEKFSDAYHEEIDTIFPGRFTGLLNSIDISE